MRVATHTEVRERPQRYGDFAPIATPKATYFVVTRENPSVDHLLCPRPYPLLMAKC